MGSFSPSRAYGIFLLSISFLIVSPNIGFAQQPLPPGDINEDAVTNHSDFFQYLLEFDPTGRQFSPNADTDGDDCIDHGDISWAILGRHMKRHGNPHPDGPTGSISGIVREDVGLLAVVIPIPDAEVWVHASHGFRMSTRTNENGEFTFPRVPVGEVKVTAQKPDFHKARAEVEVASGEESFLVLELAPKRHDLADLMGFVYGSTGPETDGFTPISGASVRIRPRGEGHELIDPQPSHTPGQENRSQLTFTNENGRYELHDLPPGSYLVIVMASGFQSEERHIVIPGFGGEFFEDFYLQLRDQHIGRVEGVVRSADARIAAPTYPPLPGARVQLEPLGGHSVLDPNLSTSPGEPPHRPSFEVITDASGHYLIEGVPPGRYRAKASAPEHQSVRFEIEVEAGQTTVQDFELPRILSEKGSVAGMVSGITPTSPDLIPIEDALVTLIPQPDILKDDNEQSPDLTHAFKVRSATTDADGKYVIRGVPEGDYLVIAAARGWGQTTGAATVIANATAQVDLVITYQPPPQPASLSGRVFGLGPVIDGQPQDPFPLAGAKLKAIPADPNLPWDDIAPPGEDDKHERPGNRPRHFETRTDDGGFYEFPRLPAGSYVIVAMKDGYIPGEQPVDLPPGTSGIADFVLASVPSGAGMVLGTVFTELEMGGGFAPVSGASVHLIGGLIPSDDEPGEDKDHSNSLPPILVFETVTNGEGYFELSSVPPGLYVIEVHADGFQVFRQIVVVEPGGQVILQIELFVEQSPPGGTLVGRVFQGNGPEGAGMPLPISGALVIALPLCPIDPLLLFPAIQPDLALPDLPCEVYATFTGPRGGYDFRNLPVGPVALVVLADGFLPAVQRAVIEAGQVTTIDFFLRGFGPGPGPDPEADLSGVVTGHSDDPTFAPVYLRNAEVKLERISQSDDKTENEYRTRTDDMGRYRFEELRSGLYEIRVKADGYQTLEDRIEIPRGVPVVRDFVLYPVSPEGSAKLEGTVWREEDDDKDENDRRPLEGAIVRLIPEDIAIPAIFPPPSVGLDRITNEHGQYRFEGLPPKGYQAVVMKDGYETESSFIQLRRGDRKEKNWTLEALPEFAISPGSGF